eukprot:6029693-Amphidinium_carterae.2
MHIAEDVGFAKRLQVEVSMRLGCAWGSHDRVFQGGPSSGGVASGSGVLIGMAVARVKNSHVANCSWFVVSYF